jgi:hypothetical protein
MPGRISLALLSVGIWLAPYVAFALPCDGPNVLHEDQFEEVDWSWRQDDIPPTVEENRLKLKPPREGKTLIEPGFLTPEGEICVTLRSPNEMTDASATEAGLVFRAERIPGGLGVNYMFFALSPAGNASLSRSEFQLQRGRPIAVWTPIASWNDVPGVRKGPGASNVLQVTLRVTSTGIDVSLSVNDYQLRLAPQSLPALAGGGEIGLRAVSEKGRIDTWKFSDLVVTDLP